MNYETIPDMFRTYEGNGNPVKDHEATIMWLHKDGNVYMEHGPTKAGRMVWEGGKYLVEAYRVLSKEEASAKEAQVKAIESANAIVNIASLEPDLAHKYLVKIFCGAPHSETVDEMLEEHKPSPELMLKLLLSVLSRVPD